MKDVLYTTYSVTCLSTTFCCSERSMFVSKNAQLITKLILKKVITRIKLFPINVNNLLGINNLRYHVFFTILNNVDNISYKYVLKNIFRLYTRKYCYNNFVNIWKSLPTPCINCSSINTLKNIYQPNWNKKSHSCDSMPYILARNFRQVAGSELAFLA